MTQSQTTSKLFAALSKAQAEMKAVPFDNTNAFLKNKYATLGAIIQASKPTLAKHGLAVVQMPISDGAQIGVETMLCHESGEWVSNRFTMPPSDSKGLSQAQCAGVVISYLRRYSLGAFLNAYADEDTDGADDKPQPSASHPQSPSQPAKVAPTPSQTPKPASREHFVRRLTEVSGQPLPFIQEFAVKAGWILPTERVEADLPIERVPKDKAGFDAAIKRLEAFANGEQI